MMTLDDIRKFHSAEPFRPFWAVLTDGTRLAVPEPDGSGHLQSGHRFSIFEGPDEFRIVDVKDVARVELTKTYAAKRPRVRKNTRRHTG